MDNGKNVENNKRVPNFTPSEKVFLLNLVCTKYAPIIEDKKTNRVGIEEKTRVWKNIEKEFNANAPIVCYRSAETLKRFYENKKKELRRKLAEDRKERFLTGGGPAPIVKLDDADEILLSIVNEKTIKGFVVTCDSDADYEPLEKMKKIDEDSALTFTVTNNTKSSESVSDMESINFDSVKENAKICNIVVPNHSHQLSENLKICQEPMIQIPEQRIETVTAKKVTADKDVEQSLKENAQILNGGVVVSGQTKNWRKFKTTDLKSPQNPALQNSSRRRPTNSVRVLTSSDVAEKYNTLLDKRLTLIQKNIEQATEQANFQAQEHKLKLETLGKENEIKELEQKEKALKIELLKLEITYKKALLSTT